MTTPPPGARYVPDLMDDDSQAAIMRAMESLYASDNLKDAWPAAYDFKKNNGCLIPTNNIDVVVLPLDRIGAPAGASGASVFVGYFSDRDNTTPHQLLVSPPLILKIGRLDKLKNEINFTTDWPTLSGDVSSHFAIPLRLDEVHPDKAVLIAPFRSQFKPDDDGIRIGIKLNDLWSLLHNPEELRPDPRVSPPNWEAIKRYVGHTLDTVAYIHRNNKARYNRTTSSYENAYGRYLRKTSELTKVNDAVNGYIPRHLFGNDSTVKAFGQQWPNPSHIVKKLIESEDSFEGVFGPVHGDLHPKNIVIGHGDTVQLIDFGWARNNMHVVVDYLLLDINIRGTTLPSQIAGGDIIAMAKFLDFEQDPSKLPDLLQPRATLIKEAIWSRSREVIQDWHKEYLIPFFLVAYGLLVYLDAARNQIALVASVLAAADLINSSKTA